MTDSWFDYLAAYGVAGFAETRSIHIGRRKNDAEWEGAFSLCGAGEVGPRWSRTPLPALENLSELRHAAVFRGVNTDQLLLDDSARRVG